MCCCLRDDAGRRLRQRAGALDRPRPPGEGHVRLRHQVPQHAGTPARRCRDALPPNTLPPCCCRRFHNSLTSDQRWIRERSHESYAKNYSVVFPFDEPLASRNMRRDPFHRVSPETRTRRTSKQTPARFSVCAISLRGALRVVWEVCAAGCCSLAFGFVAPGGCFEAASVQMLQPHQSRIIIKATLLRRRDAAF